MAEVATMERKALDGFLTTTIAAGMTRLVPQSIRRLCREGKLDYVRTPDGKFWVMADDVLDLAVKRRTATRNLNGRR